jgi:hypothetical protein
MKNKIHRLNFLLSVTLCASLVILSPGLQCYAVAGDIIEGSSLKANSHPLRRIRFSNSVVSQPLNLTGTTPEMPSLRNFNPSQKFDLRRLLGPNARIAAAAPQTWIGSGKTNTGTAGSGDVKTNIAQTTLHQRVLKSVVSIAKAPQQTLNRIFDFFKIKNGNQSGLSLDQVDVLVNHPNHDPVVVPYNELRTLLASGKYGDMDSFRKTFNKQGHFRMLVADGKVTGQTLTNEDLPRLAEIAQRDMGLKADLEIKRDESLRPKSVFLRWPAWLVPALFVTSTAHIGAAIILSIVWIQLVKIITAPREVRSLTEVLPFTDVVKTTKIEDTGRLTQFFARFSFKRFGRLERAARWAAVLAVAIPFGIHYNMWHVASYAIQHLHGLHFTWGSGWQYLPGLLIVKGIIFNIDHFTEGLIYSLKMMKASFKESGLPRRNEIVGGITTKIIPAIISSSIFITMLVGHPWCTAGNLVLIWILEIFHGFCVNAWDTFQRKIGDDKGSGFQNSVNFIYTETTGAGFRLFPFFAGLKGADAPWTLSYWLPKLPVSIGGGFTGMLGYRAVNKLFIKGRIPRKARANFQQLRDLFFIVTGPFFAAGALLQWIVIVGASWGLDTGLFAVNSKLKTRPILTFMDRRIAKSGSFQWMYLNKSSGLQDAWGGFRNFFLAKPIFDWFAARQKKNGAQQSQAPY